MAKTSTRSTEALKKSTPSATTPIQFRFPTPLLEELDAWIERLNQGRFWPPLTRSDVVRRVLQLAIQNQPDLEDKNPVLTADAMHSRAKPKR